MFDLQEDQLLGTPLPMQFLVVVIGAIVHDDITCIMVGVYAASGEVPWGPLMLACLVGTYLGDLGWFLLGRWTGSIALRWQFINGWMNDPKVVQARELLERYGSYVIIVSRFLPGLRTPVQLAAGALYKDIPRACLYFLIAAGLYAPVLVGVVTVLGGQVDAAGLYQRFGHWALVVTASVVLGVIWLVRTGTRRLVASTGTAQTCDEPEEEGGRNSP